MVNFQQLSTADPRRWQDQATRWTTLSRDFASTANGLIARYQPLHTSWAGRDADAATGHLDVLRKELLGHADRMESAATALSRQANAIGDAQWRLQMVLMAKPPGLLVEPDGTVRVDPLHQMSSPGVLDPHRIQDFADELARVVADATAADEQAAADLSRMRPPPDATVAAVTTAAAVIPPRGANPRQTCEWWQSLDVHTRDAILFEHPETIGGLDGIPAAVRDRANQSMLARRTAEIDDKIADLRRSLPLSQQADAIAPLEQQKSGIGAINARLHPPAPQPGDPPAPPLARAYLLALDTRGDGHAIVAVGDPDHADNVLTYVPGTFSSLAGVEQEINRADLMQVSAHLADRGSHTATIAWLGYDAPQSLGIDGAANPSFAHNAEGRLAGFQDGLRATHEGSPSHNTVIGHSYGTTVVGMTARDHGPIGDDIAFVGSPGVGVDHAGDLHVEPSHVWASRADHDPIQFAVSPLELAKAQPGPAGLIAQALDPTRHAYYGTDPTDAHFGGQVFHSTPGSVLHPMDTHGGYWDHNSESLANIGKIAVGHTDVSR